jgi:hypothetical protein
MPVGDSGSSRVRIISASGMHDSRSPVWLLHFIPSPHAASIVVNARYPSAQLTMIERDGVLRRRPFNAIAGLKKIQFINSFIINVNAVFKNSEVDCDRTCYYVPAVQYRN